VTHKREEMFSFWSERAKRYGCDPRANTNDIWLREIEIECVDRIIKLHNVKNVLDFGCANGYSTVRLAKNNPQCTFFGIDINEDMIEVAGELASTEGCSNLSLENMDILRDEIEQRYELIYAIRVFQNIESPQMQQRVFDRLNTLLESGGLFYYIESYVDGYVQLNMDRAKMNLPPLPIHRHLTLLTDEFDNYVSTRMKLLERSFPSSSYYLITRLLYSYIAMMNKEPIDYNHPIHQVAALVPQIGEYGPQRAFLFQKVCDAPCLEPSC